MALAYGTLTEGVHAGGFMVSEANGTRSRAKITLLSGQDLEAGTVIGAVTTGTASAAAFAGNTVGGGAMGAITVSGAARAGKYTLVVIEPASNAGTFIVTDPDGVFVGRGAVGSAFSAGGLAFTLADATDYVSGDGFTITVVASATKWKLYDPANTDGSGIAAGILWDNTDASGGDKEATAVIRSAEVNAAELVWFGTADAAAKVVGLADLAKLGIIGR